jgi:hypothetical protein
VHESSHATYSTDHQDTLLRRAKVEEGRDPVSHLVCSHELRGCVMRMFEVVYAILNLVFSGLYTSSLMLCSHKHVPYTCSSSAVDSKGQCTSRKRHKDLTYASRVMHSQVDQQTERLNHLEMHRHVSSTSRSLEAGETRSTRRRGEAMNLMFSSRRGPHRPNRDLENTSIRICWVLS